MQTLWVANHANLSRVAVSRSRIFFPEAEFVIIWRNPLDNLRTRNVRMPDGRTGFSAHTASHDARTYFGGEREMFKGVAKLRAGGRRGATKRLLFSRPSG